MKRAARKPGQEPTDASVRVAVISLAILGGVLLVSLALTAVVLAGFGHAVPLRRPADRPPPPVPRLEVDGTANLASVRRIAAGRLESWGWSDRAGGLARIPIERAMQIQAGRGWNDPESRP